MHILDLEIESLDFQIEGYNICTPQFTPLHLPQRNLKMGFIKTK